MIALPLISGCAGDPPTGATGKGRITGTVVDSTTRLPVAATLLITPGDHAPAVDSFGTFTVPDLNDGTYRVAVNATGYQSTEKSVTITDGGSITIDFELSRASTSGNPSINTPSPALGSIQESSDVVFSWSVSDGPSGDLYFDLLIGPSEQQMTRVANHITDATFSMKGLSDGAYYWQVIMYDPDENATAGPIWQFTVDSDTLPGGASMTPRAPVPADNATDQHARQYLQWESQDPDGGLLRYKVYLSRSRHEVDTRAKGASAGEILDGRRSFRTGVLSHNVTYYWAVVAYNTRGDSALGPIWNFTTYDSRVDGLISRFHLNSTLYDTVPGRSSIQLQQSVGMPTFINSRFPPPDSVNRYPVRDAAIWLYGNAALTVSDAAYSRAHTGQLSIALWFAPQLLPAGKTETLLSKRENAFTIDYSIELLGNGDESRLVVRLGDQLMTLSAGIVEGWWYHLCLTMTSNGKVEVYLNGKLVRSEALTATTNGSASQPLTIGASGPLLERFFKGGIDDIQVYNRALTEADIQKIFREYGWAL